MPPQSTLSISSFSFVDFISDQAVLSFLHSLGLETFGQLVDALSVEVLTTDLTILRVWRERLHCQCVGDVRQLKRRGFEQLPGFGQFHWGQTNEILRSHGLPEIEDDPVSALKVEKLNDRARVEMARPGSL
ncbi:MAG: hypothetical protein UX09_C0030G0002 [Candidatus Uhrbacteria bacterium GW2011_GWE2_45_35]|uniref:Uncharacterized protein n=1 Tax=Candidatus Uhrbacteria bacterium GW2011_GWE2_45_35 TaxID=1618993 RepID=A0A0G1PPQ9_9BACT|nr:MAG: hypothetical protein UX09_C0030G0002 [Candidatus Uhrbacteria bacterium GW2011_GWE2_45_35]HBR80277.1 hypothetical protein [Candidatus Uhrbacteria bacterium]HCU31735.1 hypothetical protein [Candidatus Uhrbacteria bacterium]